MIRLPLRRLRAVLGHLKWQLIERLDQLRMRRAERLRSHQNSAIERLPPVTWSGRSQVDVCMLCGRQHVDMGIAASWSLLRFAPDWRLVVFSDGTLSQDDERKWRTIIPSLCVVHKEEAAARKVRRLNGLPLLTELCSRNLYSSQLVDSHLAGDGPFVLLLDSDVLCFREPRELLERLKKCASGISWNGDLANCYCAPRGDLEAILECTLPERVNAGVLLAPRFDLSHFDAMELILQKIRAVMNDPDWLKHPWLAQTVYAALSVQLPGSSILSPDYAVSTRLSSPAVMSHYVSIPGIRARYFIQGVKQILRQAKVCPKTGGDPICTLVECLGSDS
jgi:hypothetical protein